MQDLVNYFQINMLFTKEEYKQRLKKVQKSMQEKGIELLISQDTNNMNYLTGYDAWSFYYTQCVIVHVNAEEPLCFVRAQDAGGAYIKTYLKNENNFKSEIKGFLDLNEDDRCKNYFYYLRFLTINLRNKEQILIGVATDYAKDYPDAPFIWLVNKNNQLEEIGTTNIEKYSLNFELSK